MNTLHRPSIWALSWRSLWRDLRAGDLRLLIVAVALAVAALTAVGFFADRIKGGLQRDARQLLGGDAVVSSDNPPAAAFQQKARALGLSTAETVGFPTMGRATDAQGGASKLVALKAVPAGYPLRGQLTVGQQPGEAGRTTREIPAPGEAWIDAPLLDALNLKMGDALLLGDASLRIARLIVNEPDRGAGFMNFAPRVMINARDVAATGLVQPASRVTYRVAVAGDDRRVREFVTWATEQVKRGEVRGVRVESLESGRPEMRQTLDRAEKFLNLVALLAALLSAVAVALAARGFAAGHLDDCAMLRVLGQSQRTIALSYTLEFALVGLAASLLGVAIGFGVHHVFVVLLAGLVDSALPAPSLWPAAFGLGIGLTLLVAFGLPPVLQLAKVPPLRVIRRDLGGLKPASLAVLGLGVAGFAALLLAVSSDLTLGLIAVGGFAGAVALFAALSWLAVKLLRASVNEATAPRWLVLATRQIAARPGYTVVQVSALAVGLLALVLLVLLRTDLVASWRRTTPPDASNRFVINVMPEQADAFQKALREAGVRKYDWYPMIRGRLVAVNGRAVTPDDFTEDRAKRLVDREFNLSNASTRPAHNEVVAGRWTDGEAGAVSVEEGIAKTLNLKLGDSSALRHRRRAHRRPHHQPAQGGLGLDARQLLRDVPGGQPGGRARHLHGLVPRARGPWLRQPPGARLPQHHQRGHEQHHQPGAACAGPGDPRGGVPVRLCAAGRADRAVCRRHGHARGAGARVRDHARRGRARQPAAPGAARGAGRRRPAGRLPGQHGGRGGGLGAGALRVRVRVDRHAAGAAAGFAGRGAAGAGGRLVGPARRAAPPGGGDAAACGRVKRRRSPPWVGGNTLLN
jgi:putative ABC transport system permease protein